MIQTFRCTKIIKERITKSNFTLNLHEDRKSQTGIINKEGKSQTVIKNN